MRLPLRQLRQLVRDSPLFAFKIVRPGCEAHFHLLLCFGERLAQFVRRYARALCRGRPPFLGDAAFLLGQDRSRVRASPQERSLELGISLVCFAGDQGVEPAVCARQLVIHSTRCLEEIAQPHGRDLHEERDGDSTGGSCDARLTADTERDPGSNGRQAREHRKCDEHSSLDAVEYDTKQSQRRNRGRYGKADLHDRDEVHGLRLRGGAPGRPRDRPPPRKALVVPARTRRSRSQR